MIAGVIVLLLSVFCLMAASMAIGFYDPNDPYQPASRSQIIIGLLISGALLLVVAVQLLYYSGVQAGQG